MHGKWNEFTNILSIKLMIKLQHADGKYFVKTNLEENRNVKRQRQSAEQFHFCICFRRLQTAKCRLMSVQIALQFIFASTKNSTEVNHKMQGSIFRGKVDK